MYWALVDEDTKERLDNTVNPKLWMAEWRSGDIPYVVDAIAPFSDRDKLKIEFGKELLASFETKGTVQ